MSQENKWSNRVVLALVLLTGFGAAHLIDDFLYGVPADFGLSNEATQVLALAYFVITSVLVALSARGKKAGYVGNIALGIFLAAADLLKHGDEGLFAAGPWRGSLFFSRSLAFGVMLTAINLAAVSYGAWQHARRSDKLENLN